jgi:hypothetical protein
LEKSGSWDPVDVALPEVTDPLLACDESSADDEVHEEALSWLRKRAAPFSQFSDAFPTRKL